MKQEQTFNSRAVLISALLLGLVWHFTFSYGSSIALWQSNPAALTEIQTVLTEISLFCKKFCPVLLPSAFLAFFCFGSQWLINSYELLRNAPSKRPKRPPITHKEESSETVSSPFLSFFFTRC